MVDPPKNKKKQNDKKQKDEIETVILELLEKIDSAAARDKVLQDEVKKLEEDKNTRGTELEGGAVAMREQIEAAKTELRNRVQAVERLDVVVP